MHECEELRRVIVDLDIDIKFDVAVLLLQR